MKTRSIVLLLVVGLLAAVLTACGGRTPNVDWYLQVTGDVGAPLTVSYQELTVMRQVDLTDILMEKSLGDDVITSWSGVPVADLLAQAGVSDYATITAVAEDGYAVEIPREELQDAIVALQRDGEWIPNVADEDGMGPIRLVSPDTPASRWVFQLQELRVSAAAPEADVTEPPPVAEETPPPTEEAPPEEVALDGETLLNERCAGCHALARTTSAQKTESEWDQTVTRMVNLGANLTVAEQEILVRFLAETYGP